MSEPFRSLLLPLVPLYRSALAVRDLRLKHRWEPVHRLRFPVISIGNLSTGGSGKTPLTIALAGALSERGLSVDVLSRGYGRQSSLPARVDPAGTAEQFGDEPLLIAQHAAVPVYVARQRYQAGLLAESAPYPLRNESRPCVHLLDDGFQHRQLHRDVDIILLNGQDWADRLLPAGNLREPLRAARRASIIAIPADEPYLQTDLRTWGWTGPVWRLHRTMEVPVIDGAALAFCGIARPEQFFRGLRASGLRLAAQSAFRDHHRFTPADIERLVASARAAGATALITTEKDRVRLGSLAARVEGSIPFLTARLCIEIENQTDAIDWLLARLSPGGPKPPI